MALGRAESNSWVSAYVVAEHGDENVEEISVAADGPTVAFRPVTFALVVQCKKERRATKLVRPCFNVRFDVDDLLIGYIMN